MSATANNSASSSSPSPLFSFFCQMLFSKISGSRNCRQKSSPLAFVRKTNYNSKKFSFLLFSLVLIVCTSGGPTFVEARVFLRLAGESSSNGFFGHVVDNSDSLWRPNIGADFNKNNAHFYGGGGGESKDGAEKERDDLQQLLAKDDGHPLQKRRLVVRVPFAQNPDGQQLSRIYKSLFDSGSSAAGTRAKKQPWVRPFVAPDQRSMED